MTQDQNKEKTTKQQLCAVHETAHKELHKRVYAALDAYVDLQKKVDNALVTKGLLGKKKNLKKFDKWINAMAGINSYVSECSKVYRIIFNKEMDVDTMTSIVVKKRYPQMYKAMVQRGEKIEDDQFMKRMEERGMDMSNAKVFDLGLDGDINQLPEEMRDFAESVQRALKDSGKDNVKMRFVDISSGLGVDFPSGPVPHNTKEFKEMMTETVIHKAEDEAAAANTEEPVETATGKAARDSHKSGAANPKKDKLN